MKSTHTLVERGSLIVNETYRTFLYEWDDQLLLTVFKPLCPYAKYSSYGCGIYCKKKQGWSTELEIRTSYNAVFDPESTSPPQVSVSYYPFIPEHFKCSHPMEFECCSTYNGTISYEETLRWQI